MTKLQKRVNAAKKSKQKRIAAALKKYLQLQNPGKKIGGAAVQKLKGGALKITPIKGNIAEGFYRDGVFHPIRSAYDYNVVRAGEARSSSAKDLAARARRRHRRK